MKNKNKKKNNKIERQKFLVTNLKNKQMLKQRKKKLRCYLIPQELQKIMMIITIKAGIRKIMTKMNKLMIPIMKSSKKKNILTEKYIKTTTKIISIFQA